MRYPRDINETRYVDDKITKCRELLVVSPEMISGPYRMLNHLVTWGYFMVDRLSGRAEGGDRNAGTGGSESQRIGNEKE